MLDNSSAHAGAVWLYRRTGATWLAGSNNSQRHFFKPSNPVSGASFGIAVSLSADGNVLAAGASGENSGLSGINSKPVGLIAASPDSGAAYVFTQSGGTWTQEAYIKASNPGAQDFLGQSLTLSADGLTLAVGAIGEDGSAIGLGGVQTDDAAANAGAAYVFARSETGWEQQAYVKAPNAAAGDLFGWALALSGDGSLLAVSAPAEDSASAGINGNQADDTSVTSGAVYLY
jgi:hypothetical protein